MRCGASRGTPSGSTEEYAQEAMSVVVASLLDQLGFTHTNGSSLDTLTSLAVSHIKKNFQRLHTAVEHAGRVRPVIADVERIFKNQPNLSEVDLVDYVTQCGSNAVPSLRVPRLGGIIDRSARVSASPPPGIGIRKDLPEFIPPWAPPLFTSEMSDMAQQQALVDALDDIRKKTDAERAKAEAKSRVPVWPDFSQSDLFSLGLRMAIKKSHEDEDVEVVDDQMPSTSTAEYVEPRSTYDPSQYTLEIVDRSHVGTSSSTSVNKPVLPVLRIKLIKPEPPPGTPAPEPRTPATPLPPLRLSEPNSSFATTTPTPRLSIPLLSVKRPRGRPKLKVIEEGDMAEPSIMACSSASIVDGKADGSQKTEIPILSENVPPTPPVQQRPPPQRTGVHPLLAPMEMTPGMEMLPVRRRGRPPKVKKTFHRKKVAPVAEVPFTVVDGVKKEADELNNQDVNDQVVPAQTTIDGDLLAGDADTAEADLQSVHEGGDLQDTDTEPSVYTPESPKEENQQQPAVPSEITKQLSVDVDTSGVLPTGQPTPSPVGKRGRTPSISTVVEKPSGTVPQKSPAPARIPRLKPGWVMVPDVRTPSTSSTPQISPLDAVSSTGRSQRQRALPKKFDDFECPDVPSSVLGTRSERLSFSTPASQRGRRGSRAAGGADSVGRTVEAPAPRRHRAETFAHVSPTAVVIDTRRNSLPVQEHAQGPLVLHKGRGRPKKIPTITEPVSEVTVTSTTEEPQPGPAPVPSTHVEAQTCLTPRRRGRPPKRFLPEEDVSFEPARKRNIDQDNEDESSFNGMPMTHGLRTRTGLLSPSARRVLLRDDGLTSGLRAALRRSIEDMGKNKELQMVDSGDEVERRLPIPRLSIPLLGRPPKKKRKVIELNDMDVNPVQMEEPHVIVNEVYTEEERPKLRLKITFGGSDVSKQPPVVEAQTTELPDVYESGSDYLTTSKQLASEVPVSSHHRRGRKPKKRGSHLSKRRVPVAVAYEDQGIQEEGEECEQEYMLGVVTTVEYLVEETVATIDGDAARLVPFEEIEINVEQEEESDLARRRDTIRRKKDAPFVTSVAGPPEDFEKVNVSASVPSPSRILNQKAVHFDRHIERATSQTDRTSLDNEDGPERTSIETVQKLEKEGGEVNESEQRNEKEDEMEANETEEGTTLKGIVKQVCEQASDL